VLFPVRVVLTGIADSILRLFGGTRKSHERLLTGQEFRTLLDVSEREGVVEAAERKMIDNIFDFNTLNVRDVMIPRTDMFCFSIDDTFENIMEKCKTGLYARVPVYQDNLDNILGIVYAKDLLPYIHGNYQDFHLHSFLREAYFIPEVKKLQELLKDFQEKKIHIAIAVDEYGGTAGLVCLEDLLEEIVGDITDEFDTDEDREPPCHILEEGKRYKISAMMRIHDFNQQFGTDFSQEYYGTVGGLLLAMLGKIPQKGDSVTFDTLTLTVNKLRSFRILEIVVEMKGNT
jgi:CBS domain containing-hemolysin-like protein